MNVVRLRAERFRNLSGVVFEPAPGGLTVVQGPNGSGKTSLLEALAYCSMLKSFRGVPREAIVQSGEASALIECDLDVAGRSVDVTVSIELGRRDRALRSGQRVESARDLLDVLRTTLFTPDDLELVKGAPAGRRDLVDDVVAASSPRAAADRFELERILRQRNALLRQLGGRMTSEAATTLDVWDERLAVTGERVASARELLVGHLQPFAEEAFAAIAPTAGPLKLRYVRSFEGDLAAAIAAARQDDLRRQVTTVGPHRDELELSAGGLDARTRLSQGRQRATALALRLAAHRYLTEATGSTPVLLLDDAFSELDETTTRLLMDELPKGQAILTTAGTLPPAATPTRVLRLSDGAIVDG